MICVIFIHELPFGTIAHRFEGRDYGGVDVSFSVVECPPGGAVLHTHPYEEVFVTLEGEATFTVSEDTIEVSAGHQIVVAPANVPHKFVNSGNGPLRQVDIIPADASNRLISQRIHNRWMAQRPGVLPGQHKA